VVAGAPRAEPPREPSSADAMADQARDSGQTRELPASNNDGPAAPSREPNPVYLAALPTAARGSADPVEIEVLNSISDDDDADVNRLGSSSDEGAPAGASRYHAPLTVTDPTGRAAPEAMDADLRRDNTLRSLPSVASDTSIDAGVVSPGTAFLAHGAPAASTLWFPNPEEDEADPLFVADGEPTSSEVLNAVASDAAETALLPPDMLAPGRSKEDAEPDRSSAPVAVLDDRNAPERSGARADLARDERLGETRVALALRPDLVLLAAAPSDDGSTTLDKSGTSDSVASERLASKDEVLGTTTLAPVLGPDLIIVADPIDAAAEPEVSGDAVLAEEARSAVDEPALASPETTAASPSARAKDEPLGLGTLAPRWTPDLVQLAGGVEDESEVSAPAVAEEAQTAGDEPALASPETTAASPSAQAKDEPLGLGTLAPRWTPDLVQLAVGLEDESEVSAPAVAEGDDAWLRPGLLAADEDDSFQAPNDEDVIGDDEAVHADSTEVDADTAIASLAPYIEPPPTPSGTFGGDSENADNFARAESGQPPAEDDIETPLVGSNNGGPEAMAGESLREYVEPDTIVRAEGHGIEPDLAANSNGGAPSAGGSPNGGSPPAPAADIAPAGAVAGTSTMGGSGSVEHMKLAEENTDAGSREPGDVVVTPPVERVSIEIDLLFDFDKAILKPEGKAKLNDLLGRLQGVDIEVIAATGHADRIGSEGYNQRLSERRAEAVRRYLQKAGNIPAGKLRTEGKGESDPVTQFADCQPKRGKKLIACLQPDRRVEIEVYGNKR
jgi:outer membrane protein OmpA-like peptidoglycan-associated protein